MAFVCYRQSQKSFDLSVFSSISGGIKPKIAFWIIPLQIKNSKTVIVILMKNTVTNLDSNIEFRADTGEIKDMPLLKCYFLNMALLQCPNHFADEYALPNNLETSYRPVGNESCTS